MRETCQHEGWNDGSEYRCDLPSGHPGKHVDLHEGWEWGHDTPATEAADPCE